MIKTNVRFNVFNQYKVAQLFTGYKTWRIANSGMNLCDNDVPIYNGTRERHLFIKKGDFYQLIRPISTEKEPKLYCGNKNAAGQDYVRDLIPLTDDPMCPVKAGNISGLTAFWTLKLIRRRDINKKALEALLYHN